MPVVGVWRHVKLEYILEVLLVGIDDVISVGGRVREEKGGHPGLGLKQDAWRWGWWGEEQAVGLPRIVLCSSI